MEVAIIAIPPELNIDLGHLEVLGLGRSGRRRSRQHRCGCRQDESDLHHRGSFLGGLMPPARVIAGPGALLTSILRLLRGCPIGEGAGGRNPRTQPTPGAGRSFPGSTGTFDASAPTLQRPGPMTEARTAS